MGLLRYRNLDRALSGCDAEVVKKSQKLRRGARAPRIRVPSSERARFTVHDTRFAGVLQRLSLSGGSAVLSKGPVAEGTDGEIALDTVFGEVSARIKFLQAGADGVPLAQAFRFVAMRGESAKRFADFAKLMEQAGYSDARQKSQPRRRTHWACSCTAYVALRPPS